ncbi:hypothetical protein [Microbacterium sp. 22242]|uniref:hypothetical protein n=1 Tax=Microbacterium sp. 22242 TaxID=3453896 RepID=UPI003F838FC8
MTSDPDDALRWDGDEPERAAAPTPRSRPASTPPAATPPAAAPRPARQAAAPTADEDTAGEDTPADELPAIGNAALVFLGLIGGVYLLFAVGWAVGGLRLRPRASLLVADWMYLPWMWLAVLSPVLWFAAAWVLTRGRATWIRISALIAGAALLVPWPFVMFGTVGA